MTKTRLFTGAATALITPFTDGAVDYAALEKLLEFQITGGIDALVILGTTGEPATMTAEEKAEVIRFSIEKVARRVPVIVGTGSNCTSTAIANSIAAEKAGADGILVVTPYYNKCTQNGLVEHYKAIASACPLPLIAYNVPGRTGVNILPAAAAKLAEVDSIIGIKEACGNIEQISETARLTAGGLDIISGDDGITVPILALGGIGVISVASNVCPTFMHDLVIEFMLGNVKKAAQMQLKVNPLIKHLFSEVNPIPVKMAAHAMGLCTADMRLPLTTMEPEHTKALLAEMRNFGLID